MFLIGNRQALKAVKRVDFGMYFSEDGHEDERVLLPKKEVSLVCKTNFSKFLNYRLVINHIKNNWK